MVSSVKERRTNRREIQLALFTTGADSIELSPGCRGTFEKDKRYTTIFERCMLKSITFDITTCPFTPKLGIVHDE
jgi:hypothetical protein